MNIINKTIIKTSVAIILTLCTSPKLFSQLSDAAGATLFQFDQKSGQKPWTIINDDVMGGISKSKISVKNGIASFKGIVSLENNGGFASTRALIPKGSIKDSNAIIIKVKGDGKIYKLSLRSGAQWNTANYQISFQTKKDEWLEHTLLIEDMKPTWRGRNLTLPRMNPKDVGLIGLSISDKQSGPFQIEIDWIKAVKAPKKSEVYPTQMPYTEIGI